MDPGTLGRRLRTARAARGLSQQEVSQALGLARTAITQLEAGNRSVSTLELNALSELYLCRVTDFLQDPAEDDDDDVLVVLHRAAPGLGQDPATQEQVARCIHLCREGVMLERLLGAEPRSGPPRYESRMPRSPGEAISHGEQAAEQERRRLGIGNAPIADVSELIASQAIWASGVPLPDGMSGLTARSRMARAAPLISAATSPFARSPASSPPASGAGSSPAPMARSIDSDSCSVRWVPASTFSSHATACELIVNLRGIRFRRPESSGSWREAPGRAGSVRFPDDTARLQPPDACGGRP